MAPIHQRSFRVAWPPWWVGAFFFLCLGSTAVNGATEHLPAFFLRLGVALIIFKALGLKALGAPERSRLSWRDWTPPAVALGTVFVGWMVAPNRGMALQPLVTVILVVVVYVALGTASAAGESTSDRLLAALVAVALVHAVWATVQWLVTHERATAGFFNPNDLAAFLCPAVVIVAQRLRLGKKQPGMVAVFVLLALGLVATQSRSGLLAAAAALVALAFLRGRRRVAMGVVVLALATALLVPAVRARWLDSTDPYAYARSAIWRASTALAWAEMPTGVGLGNFEDAMRHQGIRVEGPVRYPRYASDAHNEVLHAGVELGWMGLLAVLLPVAWVVTTIRAKRRSLDELLRRRADFDAAMLVALGVPALVSASLHVPVIAALAAIWAAGMVVRPRPGASSPSPSPSPPPLPAPASVPEGLVAWSLRLLVVLALLAAAPAALGQVLQTRAARLQALGLGGEAERASQWATMVTPWSLGAALQYQHLRLDHGAPPLDVAEALGDLGDRFAQNPKPLLLAAALIEKHLDKLLAKDVDENVTRVSTAGAFELIVRLYALAAEREPHNAIVWWQLGRALDRAGRADESRRAYERAVNEEPHCARALVQLALLAQRAGYPEHARALLAVIDEAIASAASENGRARDILSLDAESAKILAMIEVPSP